MEREKPKTYITIPRFIASDFKSGKITRNELILVQWLRLNTNPFGIVTVNLSAVCEDIFKGTSPNYINKLMLSLRSQKYLYYEDRQGRRGSFEVHFGDWLLPNGTIRSIEHYFNPDEVRSEVVEEVKSSKEVSHNSVVPSQKLNDNNNPFNNELSDFSFLDDVISNYNDKDKEKDKDKDKRSSAIKSKGIRVEDFYPNSYEEQKCKEIAEELGETHISFLLSVKREHGFSIIEKAWGLYKEDREKGKVILNPPAYFNGIINQILIDNSRI